jgi:PAP2 superfamily
MGVALGYHGVSVFRFGSWFSNLLLYISVIGLVLSAITLKIAFVERPEALTSTIVSRLFGPAKRQSFVDALPILVCLIIFMPAFSAIKSGIPLFSDYTWDGRLIEVDRMLHGGDAWQLIHPIVGYPIVTSILSLFYHMWILLIYAGGVFFAFRHQDAALQHRYFLSYFLIWAVNGCLLAIGMASVGPCFLEPLMGRQDFVPLMEYLREADRQYPVLVLEIQETLVAWHRLQDHGLGRGITAMPSMHVSLAFLFFLAVRNISKFAAWSAGVFLVLIMVGSVHLGYHYAIDGYLSLITTYAIWWVCGFRSKTVAHRATAT